MYMEHLIQIQRLTSKTTGRMNILTMGRFISIVTRSKQIDLKKSTMISKTLMNFSIVNGNVLEKQVIQELP